jgi:putative adenylate-forming enzyme
MDIAQAQNQQKISIEPIQVISFAEVLHQNDKQIIESVFKIPITEVYQCTEGFLGVACRNGTMHLNEDFVHFDQEWVDEDKFYPIVTDFSRHSQSIVKYKMNDLLQIKNTECACGSKLLAIEKIIGRDDDVIILNNIKVYPDIIARKIAMHTDDFQKYAITQIGPNLLEIVIACEKTDWVNTKNIFQSVLQTLFDELSIANTEFRFHQNKVNLSGNKTRKIKRLVDEN